MKPETYMDSLKILVPYPSSFNDVSNTSILFEKLLPIFKQKTNLTILWLNYQPEKLKQLPKYDSVETLDIHNYKNAVDVIQKEKPDIIYTSPYESFNEFSGTKFFRYQNIIFSINKFRKKPKVITHI